MKLGKRLAHNQALLAIAFAAGLLSSNTPAFCEDQVISGESAIQQLAENSQYSPELRAYTLLSLASAALTDRKKSELETQFVTAKIYPHSERFYTGERGEQFLADWANRLAVEGNLPPKDDSQMIPEENRTLANKAIHLAVSILKQAENHFVKLNLYYIASRLFRKSGNLEGERNCDQILETAVKSCEQSAAVDPNLAKGVVSVLNSMAYGIAPVRIPLYFDRKAYERGILAHRPGFSEKEFAASQKLKLRAAAIADRLPSTDHMRRMVHRDLVLWYAHMKKPASSQVQKEILFNLVGSRDERILFPSSAGCGRLTWWKPGEQGNFGCGMG